MKRSYIILGSIVLIVLIGFFTYRSIYNQAVSTQEEVDKTWGDVQSAYQRRADLIPQLIETVKGAAKNEKDILTQVTNARAGIVNAKTPEDMEIAGKKINNSIAYADDLAIVVNNIKDLSTVFKEYEKFSRKL